MDHQLSATRPSAAVDEQRLWDRHLQMAQLGAIPGDGVNRACLTPLDRAARRLLIGWAAQAGATVSVDDAANLWLRREGTDPDAAPVLTGSHMDTQPEGGRFDGIYGVLAGLEALTAMEQSGLRTRRPVELVAWTNEEGGRFAPGCMGSMAWSGAKPLADFAGVQDSLGITFADALAEHLQAEADLPVRTLGATPHAYIEAHIEQGPRLEGLGIPIGIVTGIQGSRWFTVTLQGRSAHAGTTPLHLRQDAMQAFVQVATALNSLMHDPADVLRFTIGRITAVPNTSNSVAGRVTFTIDLRHPDAAVLAARGDAIAGTVNAASGETAATIEEHFNAQPLTFDPAITDVIARAADGLGLAALRMPSGAFHDAQFVARVCPAAMIFVPCRGGVSHHPSEYAAPAQLSAGARVLTDALADLAR
jgi:beta-ureidopropionase / N-carbamoyl-L-amino-acid hydrolase